MIKDLNEIVKRKHYTNFLKNGDIKMDYRMTEEFNKNAKSIIENEEINERLIVLKNQLKFLTSEETSVIENTTFTEMEANEIKNSVNSNNDALDVLNFKKQTLEAKLNNALSEFNIGQAVQLKEDLKDLDTNISMVSEKNRQLNSKINNSKENYEVQMIKLKNFYSDKDFNMDTLPEGEFSKNVVNDFKREKAKEMVNEFLDSLSPTKKEQVLSENENLKGYVNVGENI